MQNTRFRRRANAFASMLAICSLLPAPASALIEVGSGNQPVADRNWSAGALEVANLKTRLGWWEGPPFGGGRYCFQYRGDTAAFNEALAAFARIKSPQLLLVVHEGPGDCTFLKSSNDAKSDTSVDWELTLWTPESFHRLYNNPRSVFGSRMPDYHGELPPPKLDVYPSTGRVDWTRVTVPAGITVQDERALANGFQDSDGSIVRGSVYDMLTSKPIAGVEVSIERNTYRPATNPTTSKSREWETTATGTSDADGRYQISHIPAGGYRLVVRHAGYAPRMVEWVTVWAHTLKSYNTQLVSAVEVTVTVSQTSGEPLTGVEVRCDSTIGIDGRGYRLPDDPTTVTDLSGHAVVPALPRGYAQFFVRTKGFYQLEMLAVHDVPAADAVQLLLTATGTLHGKVKLPAAKPATEVHVQVHPEGDPIGKWGGSSQVKADGTFQFDDIPPGRYLVSTDPRSAINGIDPNSAAVTIEPGKTTEVEVAAPPPAPSKQPRRPRLAN